MTRINNANDMIKAAGGCNNIKYVWTTGNRIYMNLVDGRKMNYLVVLNSKGVDTIRHLTDSIYMIQMTDQAYDMVEDVTRSLDRQKGYLRTAC